MAVLAPPNIVVTPWVYSRCSGDFLVGRATMLPRANRTTGERRLSCWRAVLPWLCAFSLLVVLANRVPRFPGSETSWVRGDPPQMTAKLLAKDFYLLQPPASGIFTQLCSIPVRKAREESRPHFPLFLDNRLYTRPPPTC